MPFNLRKMPTILGLSARHRVAFYRVFHNLTGAGHHLVPKLDVTTCDWFAARFQSEIETICRDQDSASMVIGHIEVSNTLICPVVPNGLQHEDTDGMRAWLMAWEHYMEWSHHSSVRPMPLFSPEISQWGNSGMSHSGRKVLITGGIYAPLLCLNETTVQPILKKLSLAMDNLNNFQSVTRQRENRKNKYEMD